MMEMVSEKRPFDKVGSFTWKCERRGLGTSGLKRGLVSHGEKTEATNHAAGTEGSGSFTGVVDDTQEHICPNDVGDLEKENMHKSGIFVIFPTLIL